LQSAGLITSERSGRQVLYRANYDAIRELILYLVQDCCAGSAELCEPLTDSLASCCNTAPVPETR
jgi:DNA-binding transcriptional ArsR family regulator